MAIGIQKQILDFEILDTGNPKTLVFLDSSEYSEEPDRPLLEVIMPGYNKYFLVNIAARKVNTFNSNTLGLTEILGTKDLMVLPDGVWTFKYKVCPYDKVFIVKNFLRTVLLEDKLNKVLFALGDSQSVIFADNETKHEIVDIILLIESAKANAEENYLKKAAELYTTANKLITRLYNKLEKVC